MADTDYTLTQGDIMFTKFTQGYYHYASKQEPPCSSRFSR